MSKSEWTCLDCKRFFVGDKRKVYPACDAFTNGIPFDILAGQSDHRKPYKGDNGIKFEPI